MRTITREANARKDDLVKKLDLKFKTKQDLSLVLKDIYKNEAEDKDPVVRQSKMILLGRLGKEVISGKDLDSYTKEDVEKLIEQSQFRDKIDLELILETLKQITNYIKKSPTSENYFDRFIRDNISDLSKERNVSSAHILLEFLYSKAPCLLGSKFGIGYGGQRYLSKYWDGKNFDPKVFDEYKALMGNDDRKQIKAQTKVEGKFGLIHLAVCLSSGKYKSDDLARDGLFYLAAIFNFKYYYNQDEYNEIFDIKKNIFEDYFHENLTKFISGNANTSIAPSGEGLIFNSYKDVIWLYFLNKDELSADEKIKLSSQTIASMAESEFKGEYEYGFDYSTYLDEEFFGKTPEEMVKFVYENFEFKATESNQHENAFIQYSDLINEISGLNKECFMSAEMNKRIEDFVSYCIESNRSLSEISNLYYQFKLEKTYKDLIEKRDLLLEEYKTSLDSKTYKKFDSLLKSGFEKILSYINSDQLFEESWKENFKRQILLLINKESKLVNRIFDEIVNNSTIEKLTSTEIESLKNDITEKFKLEFEKLSKDINDEKLSELIEVVEKIFESKQEGWENILKVELTIFLDKDPNSIKKIFKNIKKIGTLNKKRQEISTRTNISIVLENIDIDRTEELLLNAIVHYIEEIGQIYNESVAINKETQSGDNLVTHLKNQSDVNILINTYDRVINKDTDYKFLTLINSHNHRLNDLNENIKKTRKRTRKGVMDNKYSEFLEFLRNDKSFTEAVIDSLERQHHIELFDTNSLFQILDVTDEEKFKLLNLDDDMKKIIYYVQKQLVIGKCFSIVSPEDISRTKLMCLFYHYYCNSNQENSSSHRFKDVYIDFEEQANEYLDRAGYPSINTKNAFDILLIVSAFLNIANSL